jgi:hypothetical protein
MINAAVKLGQAAERATRSIELADDSPQNLSSLLHTDVRIRQAAVRKLAAAGQLPSATAFAKAAGASAATAALAKESTRDLLGAAMRSERLEMLVKASSFTATNRHLDPFVESAVSVSSINDLTDNRAAFLRAAQNAITGVDKTASENISLADKELAAKIAIEYAGMKILFASCFLAKQSASSSFFLDAAAIAS